MTADITPERLAGLREEVNRPPDSVYYYTVTVVELLALLDIADERDQLAREVRQLRSNEQAQLQGGFSLLAAGKSAHDRATAAEATARELVKILERAEVFVNWGGNKLLETEITDVLATPEIKALMETET